MTTSEGSWGAAAPSAKHSSGRQPLSAGFADLLLYGVIGLLLLAAWGASRSGWFHAGDRVGYWLGVAGGTMMLLLFSYPLRKHVRAFHSWGKAKWWLWVHMALGIGGPVLILAHSTFRIGSLNAGVALYSMLVVAGSGVVGRFLYLRVNQGLHGEQAALQALRAKAGLDGARSKLSFAPEVEGRLAQFELDHQPARATGIAAALRQAMLLPLQRHRAYRECVRALHEPLQRIALQRQWSEAERAERERLARKLVRRYLLAVGRVAQFGAYERLFALWHVLHVPFVYLLVASAAVHVVAVHAY